MHVGNLCIKPSGANRGPTHLTQGEAEEVKLGCSGVEVTLIDYTMSRAEIRPGHVAFLDLGSGEGICDRHGALQFDTYRW